MHILHKTYDRKVAPQFQSGEPSSDVSQVPQCQAVYSRAAIA
jgi:hypothetical protein